MRGSTQVKSLLLRHFNRINALSPKYAGATKIFIPENNLAHEASHMFNMIRDRPDVRTFYQKSNGKPGILKGPETADFYVVETEEHMRLNRLRFASNLFTNTLGHTAETAKVRLQEEMERYHIQLRLARTEFEQTRRVLTGKGGGDLQDDLIIAMMQCLYWGKAATIAPTTCLV